jgi:L,D-peptidoglycan transpeptidase YkuD (ErfK/YbiS/YcfS/YnhG family)
MANYKRFIVIGVWTFWVLLIGAGTYGLWMQWTVRDRPWQLEFWTDRLLAKCRTMPSAIAFGPEIAELNERIDAAKQCLTNQNEEWAYRRDYIPCMQKFLDASFTALRVGWNEATRDRSLKTRLNIELRTLQAEIDSNTNAQPGTVRNYSQFQARTLLESARNLVSVGQMESAMIAVMKARAAWAQSETFIAAELSRFYDQQLKAAWDRQARELLAWTAKTRKAAILVDKLEHRCLLLMNGRVNRTYVANLGRNWFRDKLMEHDASTPEGEYKITKKIGSSAFGQALLLDYPNAEDWKRFNAARKSGQIGAGARIGSGIEIHGGGRQNSDWTDGCVSLENDEMGQLYRQAYVGMPVTIVGASSIKE